jgi:hypothetical protein
MSTNEPGSARTPREFKIFIARLPAQARGDGKVLFADHGAVESNPTAKDVFPLPLAAN